MHKEIEKRTQQVFCNKMHSQKYSIPKFTTKHTTNNERNLKFKKLRPSQYLQTLIRIRRRKLHLPGPRILHRGRLIKSNTNKGEIK